LACSHLYYYLTSIKGELKIGKNGEKELLSLVKEIYLEENGKMTKGIFMEYLK
jgi:hypothetical protein